MNKYGHTVGYSVAEEIENEMTYAAYDDNQILLAGIKLKNNLCTNVAYDNFDRYVDTFTGKDTLHDTVSIIYQFANTDENDSQNLNQT